jgi:threonylcarbamoyladenosine tRNA methylthiotransferase MtaB
MTDKKSYMIRTLGCKVNQFETEAIARQLDQAGLEMATQALEAGSDDADICIINTCTVTHKAATQSRQAIRQAIRTNPTATVVVTGCLAQIESDMMHKIKGIDYVVGHADKHRIPQILHTSHKFDIKPQSISSEFQFPLDSHPLPFSAGARTRPFLKIQDGCNAFCTYCIVPYARGRQRSMPLENVITSLDQIQAAGFHEAVLTGIHLGSFGRDLTPKIDLAQLLAQVTLRKTIDQIRLSSLEPLEITEELLTIIMEAADRPGHICRHIHVPLQSGDDTILKRMGRPYNRQVFTQRIKAIHRAMPQAAIGVDVMLGFPGETEQAYQNTRTLIDELPIAYLHVFPFSARAGTLASQFSDKVSVDIIKHRCQEIRTLGHDKRQAFFTKHLDTEVDVLVETTPDAFTGDLKGVTSNYIKVLLKYKPGIKNTFQRVYLEGIHDAQTMRGRLIDK